MKVQVDGVDLFTISVHAQNVIQDYIPKGIFDSDIKRRIQFIVDHLYDEALKALIERYQPILEADSNISTLPSKKAALADYIMSRPDYKDKSDRDLSGI